MDSLEKSLTRTHRSPLESPDNILLEPSYVESVRRHKAREQLDNLLAWRDFHTNMSTLHRRLAEEHEQKVEALKSIDLIDLEKGA
jgi:hypothetical protein